jgi:hypothetical protein
MQKKGGDGESMLTSLTDARWLEKHPDYFKNQY